MSTIFPGSASVGQIFDGYEFNGTAWDIIGIDLTADYLETSAASAIYATKVELENIPSSLVPSLKMISGWYYKSPSQEAATTQVSNKTHWQPFLVSETTTFDRIAIRTSSTTWTAPATATIRLGIFNDNNGFPSTVALDAGIVNPSANNTTYEITINQTLSPGIYWLAFNIISSSNTGSYLGNALTSFNSMPVGKILSGTIRMIAAFTYTQDVTDGFISAPESSNNSVNDTLNTVTVFLRVA
jgi:hypothetical protein